MISLNASSAKPKKPGQKEEPKPVKKTEKELDEFRKAGAPPQVYSDDGKPTLRHQSDGFLVRPSLSDIKESYIKGAPIVQLILSYQRAKFQLNSRLAHAKIVDQLVIKRKTALKPRKIGAKFNNKDMKPADYVQPVLILDFEGKRDRWAGYNSEEYAKVVEEYEVVEK
ncbi:hypothetical protein MXB_4100, partial [Myxobolus squamalis]